MSPRLRLLIVVLTLSLGGCSFAFVHGPPPNHKQLAFFDCTTSNLLPFGDSLLGVVFLGATADAVSRYSSTNSYGLSSSSSSKADIATDAALAALLSASAIYGFVKTSNCVDAQNALLARTPPTPVRQYMFAPPPPTDPWSGRPVLAPPPGVPAPAPVAPVPAAPPARDPEEPGH